MASTEPRKLFARLKLGEQSKNSEESKNTPSPPSDEQPPPPSDEEPSPPSDEQPSPPSPENVKRSASKYNGFEESKRRIRLTFARKIIEPLGLIEAYDNLMKKLISYEGEAGIQGGELDNLKTEFKTLECTIKQRLIEKNDKSNIRITFSEIYQRICDLDLVSSSCDFNPLGEMCNKEFYTGGKSEKRRHKKSKKIRRKSRNRRSSGKRAMS
jgi:hypothetical protein